MVNNEKEVIANALLEASQNLINKIDVNIKEIENSKSKFKRGSYQEEKEMKNEEIAKLNNKIKEVEQANKSQGAHKEIEKKNKREVNTLKVLLKSLRYQLGELKSVNHDIDNLKAESKGGINKTEKKQVANALINYYELLEAKLNSVNKNINNLDLELKGGSVKKKKRKDKLQHEIDSEYYDTKKPYEDLIEHYNMLNEIKEGKKLNGISEKIQEIHSKINKMEDDHAIKIKERTFQSLLIEFPQIIEPNLKFLQEEYKLGKTNYRGDILFIDSNEKNLYIELKITTPTFESFKEQLTNYLEIIKNNERLMYIAPVITEDQKIFCRKNNIEYKMIDINSILNWNKN